MPGLSVALIVKQSWGDRLQEILHQRVCAGAEGALTFGMNVNRTSFTEVAPSVRCGMFSSASLAVKSPKPGTSATRLEFGTVSQ